MIKPGDLRTGNVLSYKISENDWAPTKIDWQDLKWLEENPEDFNRAHSPLILNDDEIRKLGFDDKGYNEGYVGIYVGHLDFILTKHTHKEMPSHIQPGFYLQVEYDERPRIKQFTEVHKLQNFYHATFDKELIYKFQI